MQSKQVIVMRKDLNMRKGKMIAQGAHASMKALLDMGDVTEVQHQGKVAVARYIPLVDTAVEQWVNGTFTKICVFVESEAELLEIYKTAKDQKIPTALICDNGLTEFGGVPTNTCCAVGPAASEIVNNITGHLKLL